MRPVRSIIAFPERHSASPPSNPNCHPLVGWMFIFIVKVVFISFMVVFISFMVVFISFMVVFIIFMVVFISFNFMVVFINHKCFGCLPKPIEVRVHVANYTIEREQFVVETDRCDVSY